MLKVFIGRVLTTIPALIGVVVVSFLLTRVLPGDTAAYFAGPAATPQAIAEVRAKLGLDKSLPDQFNRYVRDLAHGDLGMSLTTGQPVLADLEEATRLATRRQDAGLANAGPALEAHLRELGARRNLVTLATATQLARVALVAALGGSAQDPPLPVQTESKGAP